VKWQEIYEKLNINKKKKRFGLEMPWVGLQNPIFGLGKISLVIGLRVKGKMKKNI